MNAKGYCLVGSKHYPLCVFDQKCLNDAYGIYRCVCEDEQVVYLSFLTSVVEKTGKFLIFNLSKIFKFI